jgi:high-affinity iron transporter
MITTAIIAFREFLEAFLIVGVFLGISRKLNLKKEFEIVIAAAIGLMISLLMATGTYMFGDQARHVLNEENAELLENYLLIFSGLFIVYVVFSLHTFFHVQRSKSILKAHKSLQENTFDISLFLTIIFLVMREGFEIALFTASASLFSVFIQNMLGLLVGFMSASVLGIGTFFAYVKFSVGKVFKITEYMIILLGASLTQNGITELLEGYFKLHLSDILPLPLKFLPNEHTLVGHLFQSLFGIDNEFSLSRLAIMLGYFLLIYFLFLRKKNSVR